MLFLSFLLNLQLSCVSTALLLACFFPLTKLPIFHCLISPRLYPWTSLFLCFLYLIYSDFLSYSCLCNQKICLFRTRLFQKVSTTTSLSLQLLFFITLFHRCVTSNRVWMATKCEYHHVKPDGSSHLKICRERFKLIHCELKGMMMKEGHWSQTEHCSA